MHNSLHSLLYFLLPQAHSLLKHRLQLLQQTLENLDDSYVPSITDIQSLNEWAVIHAAFGDDK